MEVSTMTPNSNKRKAIEVVECRTDTERNNVLTIEELAKRVERLEEQLRALSEKSGECNSISTKREEGEEVLSSDEESVVDESDSWATMFRQLREYRMIHGDCKVPMRYDQNPKLGIWVNNQRASYRNSRVGKGSKFNPDRLVKLESIGFSWGKKFPPPASWDEMFDQLQLFQKRMGNCNVPLNATNPTPLAKWVAYQRKEYKLFKKGCTSLLTLDQIGQLNDVGMSWKGSKL